MPENLIRDIILNASFDELNKMLNDLSSDSVHIKKLVASRLAELEEEKAIICATCGKKINTHENDNYFTLYFGPSTFRRRASFCALDCMQYFIREDLDASREAGMETKMEISK